ncbi:hypothetical protein ETB97_010716 [Aspergillus alliaceus]|uniref:Uncharacterized protein n=1 Tax=Petromyces alliaceus TaxID=209559 RepID=A0A8H6AHD1_PETAA|nr:hypothetical protein ETB97_010716 [Aspergillus burnettii]
MTSDDFGDSKVDKEADEEMGKWKLGRRRIKEWKRSRGGRMSQQARESGDAARRGALGTTPTGFLFIARVFIERYPSPHRVVHFMIALHRTLVSPNRHILQYRFMTS